MSSQVASTPTKGQKHAREDGDEQPATKREKLECEAKEQEADDKDAFLARRAANMLTAVKQVKKLEADDDKPSYCCRCLANMEDLTIMVCDVCREEFKELNDKLPAELRAQVSPHKCEDCANELCDHTMHCIHDEQCDACDGWDDPWEMFECSK
jgi:hypothetical protein